MPARLARRRRNACPCVWGVIPTHSFFFAPKNNSLVRGAITQSKEKKMKYRVSLKRKQKTPVGTYVPTVHSTTRATAKVENNVYQEMALNQRARANARSGNTLLASWMQESANRFATLRKQNREPNIPENIDPRTRRDIPLMWDGYSYDVQGELLYDDEVVM